MDQFMARLFPVPVIVWTRNFFYRAFGLFLKYWCAHVDLVESYDASIRVSSVRYGCKING